MRRQAAARHADAIGSRPKMSVRAKLAANTTATMIASAGNRVWTSSAPVGPWSVRSPIRKKNSPKAIRAAKPASFSAAATGVDCVVVPTLVVAT